MESRIVTPSEFMKEIKRAEKATGKKFKIPSSTQKLCEFCKNSERHY